jgi:hypothetical protein
MILTPYRTNDFNGCSISFIIILLYLYTYIYSVELRPTRGLLSYGSSVATQKCTVAVHTMWRHQVSPTKKKLPFYCNLLCFYFIAGFCLHFIPNVFITSCEQMCPHRATRRSIQVILTRAELQGRVFVKRNSFVYKIHSDSGSTLNFL